MSAAAAIRPLDIADARVAADLHAVMPEPWTEKDWAGFLADPLVVALGTEEDAELVGAILVRVVADEAEVLTNVVAERARGRGIGRDLLDSGLEEAVRRGAATAFLEVAVDNSTAIALYRRAGFVEIGRRRGYYRRAGGAIDAILMRRA
jgi:[ribosomal protein S18]-alanine N-acetyltransferase